MQEAIAASLDLRTHGSIAPLATGVVRIALPDLGIAGEWTVEELAQLVPKHGERERASAVGFGIPTHTPKHVRSSCRGRSPHE